MAPAAPSQPAAPSWHPAAPSQPAEPSWQPAAPLWPTSPHGEQKVSAELSGDSNGAQGNIMELCPGGGQGV